MEIQRLDNLGFDLVRATEAAAINAGRWMGLGKRAAADQAAAEAMYAVLSELDIDGRIVVGEEAKLGSAAPMEDTRRVGTGEGPAMDVVLDPIDGRALLAQGKLGAISVAAIAPRGSMWSPASAAYMEKIVVSEKVASALVTECMDAPAAWTLALVARAEKKDVRDLVVFVLDRPRHADLIEEIRAAGARVLLRADGDIFGALMAASPDSGVDLLLGIGGTAEGLIAACAVKALGGAMLGRLWLQDEAELQSVTAADIEPGQILTCDELVSSDDIFFATTGITDNPLLTGVHYRGNRVDTESLLLRGLTGTRRKIHTVFRTS